MLISLTLLFFVAIPHWTINLAWTFVVKDAEDSKSWKVSMWCAWSEFLWYGYSWYLNKTNGY